MEVTTYRVDVRRGDTHWLVHVPQIDRTTQARTLREVEAMARDLIAVMEDVSADSFSLEVAIYLPESVRRHLERSARLREDAARAQAQAAAESRLAARELRDAGLPIRDVGKALGVSHQRAQQLVSA